MYEYTVRGKSYVADPKLLPGLSQDPQKPPSSLWVNIHTWMLARPSDTGLKLNSSFYIALCLWCHYSPTQPDVTQAWVQILTSPLLEIGHILQTVSSFGFSLLYSEKNHIHLI